MPGITGSPLVPSGRARCLRRSLRGNDPLSNLAIGDRPAPRPAAGWALVRVAAASLNHHDLWTLRGVSSQPLNTPQILGCDAAGRVVELGEGTAGAPAPGTRVVVHSVIGCGVCSACLAPEPGVCHRLSLLGEPPHGGALAELVAVPPPTLSPCRTGWVTRPPPAFPPPT